MSVTIIINPVSGGSRPEAARARAEIASAIVERHGDSAEVFLTERPGHARELAASAAARGARLVMAWGGDGTINEIASANPAHYSITTPEERIETRAVLVSIANGTEFGNRARIAPAARFDVR